MTTEKEKLVNLHRPQNKPPEHWTMRMMEVVRALRASQDTLEAMIELGADVNFHDPVSGETAMIAALKMARSSFAIELIKQGARVNDTNNAGETPLMLAAKLKMTRVIEVLVENGADFKAEDKTGETALCYAAFSEDRATFDQILAFYDILPVPALKKALTRCYNAPLKAYVETLINVTAKQQQYERLDKALTGGAVIPPAHKKPKLIVRRRQP